jgi:hypothetical protein
MYIQYLKRDAAIKAAKFPASNLNEVVLDYVHHTCHLKKYQSLVPMRFQNLHRYGPLLLLLPLLKYCGSTHSHQEYV